MRASRFLQRQIVLSKLYDHLHRNYSFSEPKRRFLQTNLHDIDAVLAFKSDINIEEFKSALERVEAGRFGACQHCGGEILFDMLEKEPCRRYCVSCERRLLKATLHHATN